MSNLVDKIKFFAGGNDAGRGGLSVIQDFYLEFFGTLLPGVIAVTSVVALALGFFSVASGNAGMALRICKTMATSWECGLLFLAISYVMGAIAYRRSPKTPDTIASHRQWMATRNGTSKDEVGRLSVAFDESKAIPRGLVEHIRFWWNREQWILHHGGDNIDYPYPNMRQYLCCRDLEYLANYIPWCAGDGGSSFKGAFKKGVCSKNYVNIIKQRLRNSGRKNLILDMVRNECNIRMLSSLWYIFVFVRKLLLWALPAIVVAVLATGEPTTTSGDATGMSVHLDAKSPVSLVVGNTKISVSGDDTRKSRLFWFAFCDLAALALVIYCQNSIEHGFHYVRTREVTMILETAHILENVEFLGDKSLTTPNSGGLPWDLFADMKQQASAFKKSHCMVCKCWNKCYGADAPMEE